MVTLSEINITPLLDLAFVLLIIFIITTPLLEKSISLKLPLGGAAENKKIDPRNIRTVEISNTGYYKLDRTADAIAADDFASRARFSRESEFDCLHPRGQRRALRKCRHAD